MMLLKAAATVACPHCVRVQRSACSSRGAQSPQFSGIGVTPFELKGYVSTNALGISFRRPGVQALDPGRERPKHQHEGAHSLSSQAGGLQDHAPPVVLWTQRETSCGICRAGGVLGVQTEASVHEPVHRAAADGRCWRGREVGGAEVKCHPLC